MIALLLAALVVQAEPPTLDASVDQDRVMVGEEVTYRLRATSRSQAPMELTVAPFTGLETVSRSERTELSLGATATRTTVLEVRLRAVRPGRWQLGPARAVQGRDTVEASALVLDVSASRAPASRQARASCSPIPRWDSRPTFCTCSRASVPIRSRYARSTSRSCCTPITS